MSVYLKKLTTAAGLLLIVSLFLVTPASASTITVYGGPVNCSSTLTTTCSGNLDVDLFDSTTGTLTAVTVEIQGNAAMEIGFTIADANVAKITATTTAQVIDPMGNIFDVAINGLLNVNGLDKGTTYLAGDFPVVVSPGTVTFSYSLPADLSPFIGSGSGLAPFPAFVFTALTSTIPGPQLTGITASSDAAFNATVTYTYDATGPTVPAPVPEPATYALFGLGLIGVARKLRRS